MKEARHTKMAACCKRKEEVGRVGSEELQGQEETLGSDGFTVITIIAVIVSRMFMCPNLPSYTL